MNTHAEPQVTLKLAVEPRPWLRFSLSGLRTGALGNSSEPAESAIEWGGTHVEPITDTFRNGSAQAADPSLQIEDVFAWEADLILTREGVGRIWLAGGQVFIEADSSNAYDRDLAYWIAEGIFELGAVVESLDRFYLALRYSALGTFDRNEGYFLPAMVGGDDLGFDAKRVDVVSAGGGVRLTDSLIFKLEYTHADYDLVRGTTTPSSLTRKRDYLGGELTMAF